MFQKNQEELAPVEATEGEKSKGNKRDKRKSYAWLALVGVLLLAIGVFAVKYHELSKQMKERDAELAAVKEALSAEIDKKEPEEENETPPVITSETIEEQLGALSDLVTQEYSYRNADCKESSETWIFGWTRPFSSKSILIAYDGTIKAGIDFSKMTVDVDEQSHVITIDIPESAITENDIPQEGIEVLEVKNGLFNKVTFDNYNDFVSEQKKVMEQKAIDQGILEKADEEAERLIERFVSLIPGIENYRLEIK